MLYRDVKINEFYKTVRDGVCRVYAKNNPDPVDNRSPFLAYTTTGAVTYLDEDDILHVADVSTRAQLESYLLTAQLRVETLLQRVRRLPDEPSPSELLALARRFGLCCTTDTGSMSAIFGTLASIAATTAVVTKNKEAVS